MLASMTPMWLASVLVSRINLQQRNGDQPEAMDVKKWHRIWQKPEIWGKNQSSSKNLSSSPGQLHSSITCLLIFTFTCYNICIKIVKSTINNKGPRVRVCLQVYFIWSRINAANIICRCPQSHCRASLVSDYIHPTRENLRAIKIFCPWKTGQNDNILVFNLAKCKKLFRVPDTARVFNWITWHHNNILFRLHASYSIINNIF